MFRFPYFQTATAKHAFNSSTRLAGQHVSAARVVVLNIFLNAFSCKRVSHGFPMQYEGGRVSARFQEAVKDFTLWAHIWTLIKNFCLSGLDTWNLHLKHEHATLLAFNLSSF